MWIAGYASGDMGVGSKAARDITNMWVTACKRVGLVCPAYASNVAPTWSKP
jgi:hypothetical protein